MTRRQTLGLLALSLWSGSAWLTDQFMPSFVSPFAAQGFRLLLIALVSVPFLRPAAGMKRYGIAAAVSIGLFALPVLLLDAARGRIASTTGVVIFALLPIVLAVAPQVAEERTESPMRMVPYILLGVAGLLVLLPVPLPGSAFALFCLLAAMLLTAACFVWMHRLLALLSLRIALLAICAVNGGFLLLIAGHPGPLAWDRATLIAEALRALTIDLPQTFLLLWLLKGAASLRVSARYLLAPLFTVLEGLAILRPRFETRTLLGIALLSAGAWFVVRSKEPIDEQPISLR